MGLNLIMAAMHANKMSDCSSELRKLQNRLNSFRTRLNNAWKAEEMVYVNIALDTMNNEISRLTLDIDGLSHDIMHTAREIHREEEARARAAKALKK